METNVKEINEQKHKAIREKEDLQKEVNELRKRIRTLIGVDQDLDM